MSDLSCPQCGTAQAPRFRAAKMVTCPSCGTTLYLDDQAARLAGDQGVLHELPAPIGLGEDFRHGPIRLTPLGFLRYDYGPGTWDEYWCIDPKGEGIWLSVDEGEMVLQAPIPQINAPKTSPHLRLGHQISFQGLDWTITEIGTAKLIGWRGELPFAAYLNAQHSYLNCSRGNRLLSAELWPREDGTQGSHWSLGQWLDPYDIRPSTIRARA